MPPVFEVINVDFCYADGTSALHNLNLAFALGRRTAVLGCNGAGKSTLFSLLNGLERPSRGEIRFKGQALGYDRRSLRDLRRRVGLVLQDPDSQLFSASIREDVSFGPLNLGWPKDEVRQRVERAIAAVGLTSMAGRPIHALSYGEKKRACLAGVLAMDPEVLILDEPAAGLDPPTMEQLSSLLNGLHADGRTVIVATHDVDFAFAWADDICVLQEGRTAFQGLATDFDAVCRVLPSLGMGLPIVFELFAALRLCGMVEGGAPPRTRAELIGRLGHNGQF